jgi:hypothetical protein
MPDMAVVNINNTEDDDAERKPLKRRNTNAKHKYHIDSVDADAKRKQQDEDAKKNSSSLAAADWKRIFGMAANEKWMLIFGTSMSPDDALH